MPEKMRIFKENDDELFSLNTQAGASNSHEFWVKVKEFETSFSWAGEMGHWLSRLDGLFPKINEHTKTTKPLK